MITKKGFKMKRVIFIFAVSIFFLSGCVSSLMPMTKQEADNLRQGTTAVAFFDKSLKINYVEDVYRVLAITQNGSSSSYRGIWNSDAMITDAHVKGFRGYGVNAKSAFKILNKKDIMTLQRDKQAIFTGSHAAEGVTHKLNKDVRSILLKKKIENLVLFDWHGFTLHIKTLGLSPQEKFHFNFKIFNVPSGKMVWQGYASSLETVDIGNKGGKAYLERRDLANLKSDIKRMINNRYTAKSGSIGQLIGLQASEK